MPGVDTEWMTHTTHIFHHRRRNLIWVICLLTAIFGIFLFAVLVGSGYDPDSNHSYWALVISLSLAAVIGLFVWVLLRNPRALVIDEDGINIPLAFKQPLRWEDIHRIRRVQTRVGLYGRRDWLIIDPSPGILAPLRLPVWRRLELWFQSRHGVRIPLHGLEGAPDEIVRSIQRFRPVVLE